MTNIKHADEISNENLNENIKQKEFIVDVGTPELTTVMRGKLLGFKCITNNSIFVDIETDEGITIYSDEIKSNSFIPLRVSSHVWLSEGNKIYKGEATVVPFILDSKLLINVSGVIDENPVFTFYFE